MRFRPGFPVRGSAQDCVCGFQYGKPHEVRQRRQGLQEIRGSAVGAALYCSIPEPSANRTAPAKLPNPEALWNPNHEFQLKASKRYITIGSTTVLL
jgi:hypothetical protein